MFRIPKSLYHVQSCRNSSEYSKNSGQFPAFTKDPIGMLMCVRKSSILYLVTRAFQFLIEVFDVAVTGVS